MTLLIVSFVAGALTVLAPCILPLLPVIIGGSVSGKPSPRRAFVITASLAVSVFLFTLLLKVSTAFINIPPDVWQWLSGGIIFLIGLFMFFPGIWERLMPAALQIGANKIIAKGHKQGSMWGDIVIGAALGPVFTSCSPTYFILLATVLPVHFGLGLLYLLAYVAGLALVLFLVAFAGQRVVSRLDLATDSRGWIKRSIGLIFILLGLAIVFGFDKTLQQSLPAGAFGIADVEQKILTLTNPMGGPGYGSSGAILPGLGSNILANTPAKNASTDGIPSFLTLAEKNMRYQKALELASPDAYLNTNGQPITIGQFKGKNVVLIDFWTYSCINCQRTIPYLTSWYTKYKDQGLVIIAVHTPEFSFEHVTGNVAAALKQFGITYPVVLDNEYGTWNAFGNQFWPREYLIDIDGFIVHDHAGEGEYDVTEKAIQAALAERAQRLGTSATGIATTTTTVAQDNLNAIKSPETYFGAMRNEFLGNGTPGDGGTKSFTLPVAPSPNRLYLGGSWNIEHEDAVTMDASESVLYAYSANDIYFVASADAPVTVEVVQDGVPVGSAAGADVDPKTSTVTIQANRLYKLVHNAKPGAHTIQLKIKGAGLHAYTFTFG